MIQIWNLGSGILDTKQNVIRTAACWTHYLSDSKPIRFSFWFDPIQSNPIRVESWPCLPLRLSNRLNAKHRKAEVARFPTSENWNEYANGNANGTILAAAVMACENDYIRVWVTFPRHSPSFCRYPHPHSAKANRLLSSPSALDAIWSDSESEFDSGPGTDDLRTGSESRPFGLPVAVALRKLHCMQLFFRSRKLLLHFVVARARRHQLLCHALPPIRPVLARLISELADLKMLDRLSCCAAATCSRFSFFAISRYYP